MGRPAAPIGAVNIFSRDGRQFRAIKVLDAEQRPVWRPYANHVYVANHGPIPRGRRVLHADGDSLNDEPSNLVLGTAADALFISLEKPHVEAKRVKRVRKAYALRNREVASINRAFRILRSEWYLTIQPKRFVRIRPAATRRELLEQFDLPSDLATIKRLRKLGIVPTLGQDIPREGIARVDQEEFHKALHELVPDLIAAGPMSI